VPHIYERTIGPVAAGRYIYIRVRPAANANRLYIVLEVCLCVLARPVAGPKTIIIIFFFSTPGVVGRNRPQQFFYRLCGGWQRTRYYILFFFPLSIFLPDTARTPDLMYIIHNIYLHHDVCGTEYFRPILLYIILLSGITIYERIHHCRCVVLGRSITGRYIDER